MKIAFAPRAWKRYLRWLEDDLAMHLKINTLLDDITRHPFQGLGKPESLSGDLAGFWSRRISGEHRLVYLVRGAGDAQELFVVQCRFHYRP